MIFSRNDDDSVRSTGMGIPTLSRVTHVRRVPSTVNTFLFFSLLVSPIHPSFVHLDD